MEETSSSYPAAFLNVLQPQYMQSSVISSHTTISSGQTRALAIACYVLGNPLGPP